MGGISLRAGAHPHRPERAAHSRKTPGYGLLFHRLRARYRQRRQAVRRLSAHIVLLIEVPSQPLDTPSTRLPSTTAVARRRKRIMNFETCHFCGERFEIETDAQDYSCAASLDRECVYSCQKLGCRLPECSNCRYPTCHDHLIGGQCATCRQVAAEEV